jgi:hypothetical protein
MAKITTLMKRGYNTSKMQIFDTRDEMIASIPKGGLMAELGVFKGEFSVKIDEICQPDELILIDSWTGERLYSGNVDGNHRNGVRQYYTGEELYYLTEMNIKECRGIVTMLKANTDVLKAFTDNIFDMIYVDADHSYKGVLNDLINAYHKIKNGGYIMGHDYEHNMHKTNNSYSFGVKQAVDEFCREYNQEISMKGMDGCVSYGIKISK